MQRFSPSEDGLLIYGGYRTDTRTLMEELEKPYPYASSMESLPTCSMYQFRKKIAQGAEPVFALDDQSTLLKPIWRLYVKDKSGTLFQVAKENGQCARRLSSIKQVYQIARIHGLSSISIPVECRRG